MRILILMLIFFLIIGMLILGMTPLQNITGGGVIFIGPIPIIIGFGSPLELATILFITTLILILLILLLKSLT